MRCGGLQEVSIHPNASREAANYRGAWEDSSNNSVFYMKNCNPLLQISGKAISGWPDSRGPVFSPSCNVFLNELPDKSQLDDEVSKTTVNNMLVELFEGPYDIISERSHLRPFGFLLFASFLRWYPTFVEDVGVTHVVIRRVKEIMTKYKVSTSMFNHWVDLVKEEFNLNNTINPIGAVVNISDPLMTATQTVLQNQRTTQTEIRSMYNKLSRIEDNLATIVDCVLSIKQYLITNESSQYSSPRKRTPKNTISSPKDTTTFKDSVNASEITTSVLQKSNIITDITYSEIDDNLMESTDNRYFVYNLYC